MAGVSCDRLITFHACRGSCVAYVATQDSGWRGRIRTFDLLIQSQVTDFRYFSPVVSTKPTNFCPEFYRVW